MVNCKDVTFAFAIFAMLEKYPLWIYIAVSMRQVTERVVKSNYQWQTCNFCLANFYHIRKISPMDLYCSDHEASGGKSGKSAIAGGKVVTFALRRSLILFACAGCKNFL